MDQSAIMTEAQLVVLLYLYLGLARVEVEKGVSRSVRRYCERGFGLEAKDLYLRLPRPELRRQSEYYMVEARNPLLTRHPHAHPCWSTTRGSLLRVLC